MKILITSELIAKYCELIGDDNPIHDSDNTVKYGEPVAPGILVTALITRNPKPYWALGKLNVRYHDAVYVGDTIEISSKIIKERKSVSVHEVYIHVGDSLKQTIQMTTIKII